MAVPAARAAVMATPGAAMSGLAAPSPIRGPRLENVAIASFLSTAATVSASSAEPGETTFFATKPELPAATTNRVPVDRLSSLSAWLRGSVPSVGSPPRLMLTILAPEWAAQSMPAMIASSGHCPWSSQTLPTSSLAPGATPLRRPLDAAPLPRTVEATWVPCPWPSLAPLGLPVKSTCPAMLADTSGWVASIPVSSTATFTPVPS